MPGYKDLCFAVSGEGVQERHTLIKHPQSKTGTYKSGLIERKILQEICFGHWLYSVVPVCCI